jgi:N12 class adenine-specific DNA methylase
MLPGITEKWNNQLHNHQKDAIWRVVQDRTALLAHEVGFGKTAVMVASGMELRRMGLSRKCFLQVGIPHFCKTFSPAPVGKIKLT